MDYLNKVLPYIFPPSQFEFFSDWKSLKQQSRLHTFKGFEMCHQSDHSFLLKGTAEYFWSVVVWGVYAQSVCDLLQLEISGVTFRRRRRNLCSWSQHCAVADEVSRKTFFSNISKCLPNKSISIQLYTKWRFFFSPL